LRAVRFCTAIVSPFSGTGRRTGAATAMDGCREMGAGDRAGDCMEGLEGAGEPMEGLEAPLCEILMSFVLGRSAA
jgi:hypothetical protein